MSPSSRTRSTKARDEERASSPGAGLEDVTRALRVLTRNGRDLVTDVGEVLEREVAMAVSISERLRDESVSKELLKDARAGKLQGGFRDSSHRIVDLVADAMGVATVSTVRFGERIADQPRRRLDFEERRTTTDTDETAAESA